MASTPPVTKPKAQVKASTVDAAATTPMDEQSQADPMDALLAKVKADYQSYYTYIRPYRRKWDSYWKLWNNKRVLKQYHGDSDSFDPMVFQMVETGTDNVYGGQPKLTFLPTQPQQETDTKILNGLWDFSWDKSSMDSKVVPWGREIKITGNGCLFPTWEDGYMKVNHYPMRDCILDISAAKPELMRFAGYRRLDMIENLKVAKRFDPTAGEPDESGETPGAWVQRYDLEALKTLRTWGMPGGDDATDKQLKDMYSGSTLATDLRKGQVEIIYMMYKDQIVEIANRQTIVARFDNPYQMDAHDVTVQQINDDGDRLWDEDSLPQDSTAMSAEELQEQLKPTMGPITVPAIEPFIPVVFQRRYIDPSILIGKGDVEPLAASQEDLNDSINTKRDNTVYSVQNIGVIDELAKSAVKDLAQAKPGSIVPIKGLAENAGTFRWLEKPDMTGAADTEINRLKMSIRETARIDLTNQGIMGKGDRTATEVDAQTAGASSGFTSETKALESGAYKQLGEMFVKMVQIFLTEKQLIRIVGKEGVEFKQFDPEKYWGEYDVKVVLQSTAQAKQKADAEMALEAFQTFRGDPDFNQIELKKLVAAKTFDMDDDDIKLLMNPSPGNTASNGGASAGDGVDGSAPAQLDANGQPVPQIGPDGKPITPVAAPVQAPASATAVTTPGGQVHESADLAKIYIASAGRPDIQDAILKLMDVIPDDADTSTPPDLVSKAQDIHHKDLKMAMELEKHGKAMTAPEPVPAGATNGVA